MVPSGFDGFRSGELPPDNIEVSRGVHAVSRSLVVNVFRPMFFGLGLEGNYERITFFLCEFLVEDSDYSSFFLSKKSVFFGQDKISVRGTASTDNENGFVMALLNICHN